MVKPIIKKSVCKNHKNECECCHIEFSPSPRLGARQKTCGAILCKKHHRAKYRRHYRKENAAIEKEYRSKRPTGYWREYRSGHPNYVNKNRFMNRMAQRVRRAGLQRQLDILELVEFPSKISVVVGFATSTRSLWEAETCKKCG